MAFSDDNKLTVWDITSTNKHLEMSLHDRVICAIHPHTYLNKVLLAFEDGSMQLWNLKSNELVYNFKGWGSPIRSLQQSPALDVVAVGLHDGPLTLAATFLITYTGRIIVQNLRYDETIVTFSQHDPVTALAFRTGTFTAPALTSVADCCVRRFRCFGFRKHARTDHTVASREEEAHHHLEGTSYATVYSFLNEASSFAGYARRTCRELEILSERARAALFRNRQFAQDVAIRVDRCGDWRVAAPPASLAFRSRKAPPLCVSSITRMYYSVPNVFVLAVVRFYSHAELLSAGSDRALRMTSIIQDQQSRELSQGHVASRAKKLRMLYFFFLAMRCS